VFIGKRADDTIVKKLIMRILNFIQNVLRKSKAQEKEVVDEFHRLYFENEGRTWMNTSWFGINAQKCPLDLWVYQETIYETRPDLIIECGTAKGGCALFLASMCDLLNHGEVASIDIEEDIKRPIHERIKYLTGSSTSEEIVRQIKDMAKGRRSVLVILDSDHTKDHVLNELKIYSEFVTSGNYLIAEDTNLNGNPLKSDLYPHFNPGPMEAVNEFLRQNRSFYIDKNKEKFYLTFNPNGYLKKI
jgi:cephalosporin hydroxylase